MEIFYNYFLNYVYSPGFDVFGPSAGKTAGRLCEGGAVEMHSGCDITSAYGVGY